MPETLSTFNDSWILATLRLAGMGQRGGPGNPNIGQFIENLSKLSPAERDGLVGALRFNGGLTAVAAQAGLGNHADLMSGISRMFERAERMARSAKTPEDVRKAQQALAAAQKLIEMMSTMAKSQHDASRGGHPTDRPLSRRLSAR